MSPLRLAHLRPLTYPAFLGQGPSRFAAGTLLAASLLAGCGPDATSLPAADGDETSVATVVVGADGNAAAVTPNPAATPQVQPEPTESDAAVLATEIAAREQPVYARSLGRNGFEDGEFQLPNAMAIDDAGKIYVLDTTGIQIFDEGGTFLQRISDMAIAGAQSIAVVGDGSRIYVGVRPGPGIVGAAGVGIVVLDAQGSVVSRIGEAGSEVTQLASPAALALDSAGRLYVADANNRRVEVFTPEGSHVRTIGEPGEGRGQFTSPRALAFDAEGRLYVGQGDTFLVQRFAADGTYEDTFGRSLSDETIFRVGGVTVGPDGRIYVARSANHYVQVFDARELAWLGDLGELGRETGTFNTPLKLLTRGEELFVVDQQNHRVQVFTLPAPRP